MAGRVLRGVLGVSLAAAGVGAAGGGVAGQASGLGVEVRSGTCADVGDPVAVLDPIVGASGSDAGAAAAEPAVSGYGVAPSSLDALLDRDHSIAVVDETGGDVACGEVGGVLDRGGSLVFGLRGVSGSGIAGVAFLSPTASGSSETGVSVFLTGSRLPGLAAPRSAGDAAADGAGATAAGPPPTPTAGEKMAAYAWLPDVRELAIRPGALIGEEFAFAGTVLTIREAGPGRIFTLGDTNPQDYEALLQVTVAAPDGSTEVVMVGYDGDTTGVFEGTYVSVFGEVVDTNSFENTLGGGVTQPLVAAEFVVIG